VSEKTKCERCNGCGTLYTTQRGEAAATRIEELAYDLGLPVADVWFVLNGKSKPCPDCAGRGRVSASKESEEE
jgi:hypothetical protein